MSGIEALVLLLKATYRVIHPYEKTQYASLHDATKQISEVQLIAIEVQQIYPACPIILLVLTHMQLATDHGVFFLEENGRKPQKVQELGNWLKLIDCLLLLNEPILVSTPPLSIRKYQHFITFSQCEREKKCQDILMKRKRSVRNVQPKWKLTLLASNGLSHN